MRFYTVIAFVLMSKLGLAATGPAAVTNSAETHKTNVSHYRRDTVGLNSNPLLSGPALFFKDRLVNIQKEVQLDYNEFVQTYIDSWTSPNRRDEAAKMLGLAKYYFPIYEKAFRDAGIPDEIKYLSIVESSLNPNATSRVGAAGLWQFMPTTGRNYGLNINNYVDERRDPIQASYAAAAYLKDAYQEFGDWLLAIASYNCGKGSVERAIEKANALDYWSIRPYLPAETRNYVPAFIAVTYVMNYYDQHKITPQMCALPQQTDTIMVNKFVSLSNISRVINVDLGQLAALNPAYRKLVINGTATAPRRLILPQISQEKFGVLYAALNGESLTVPSEPVFNTNEVEAGAVQQMPQYHTIKRGETLAAIADKYGMELSDLKEWNHITRAVPGKVLRLTAPLSASN